MYTYTPHTDITQNSVMYTIYTHISPSCAWILYNKLLEAAEKE